MGHIRHKSKPVSVEGLEKGLVRRAVWDDSAKLRWQALTLDTERCGGH